MIPVITRPMPSMMSSKLWPIKRNTTNSIASPATTSKGATIRLRIKTRRPTENSAFGSPRAASLSKTSSGSSKYIPVSLQPAIQPFIGDFADLGGKIVFAVRITGGEPVASAEELIHRLCRGDAVLDAADLEVIVMNRRARQKGPRGDGRHDFREI